MSRKSSTFLFLAVLSAASAWAAPYRTALLNDAASFEFIKGKFAAGAEPWKSAYAKAAASEFASLSRTPKTRAVVECGPYSDPDYGCSDERTDAKTAYTQALLWRLDGKATRAAKAAELLDAWSAVLKSHTNHNAPLQASWSAALFARAAVILQEGYPAWPQANRDRLSRMFAGAFLPIILPGNDHANGNWELSYIEAMMSIGVFSGDTAAFNRGLFLWRLRVPAYLYLKSDGPTPVKPYNGPQFDDPAKLDAHWYHPQVWPDGLSQETCRDFAHLQMGIAAMINAAEIAWHQGIDLYSGEARRITTAMEFHAGLLLGNAAPAGLCGGTLNKETVATWEIAYNHFHDRKGMDLPLTRRLVEKMRPVGTYSHMAWETLTHAGTGIQGTSVMEGSGAATDRWEARLAIGTDGLRLLKSGASFDLTGKRMPD